MGRLGNREVGPILANFTIPETEYVRIQAAKEIDMTDLYQLPTVLSMKQRRKRRYNVSFDPDDVVRMDALAAQLGVSRSELLTFAFNRLASELRGAGVGA